MRLPSDRQADLDAAVADMAEALRAFSASLTDAQRQQLMFPLDALERTTSRDTRMTPAFCAVLTWCAQGWGLSLGTLSFEQRTAFEGFLRIALGPSGYATVSAIRDRQNLIGVLENSANPRRSRPRRNWRPAAHSTISMRSSKASRTLASRCRPTRPRPR